MKRKYMRNASFLCFTVGKLFKVYVTIFLMLLISCTAHAYAFDDDEEISGTNSTSIDSKELLLYQPIYSFRLLSNETDSSIYFEDIEEWQCQKTMSQFMPMEMLDVWDIGDPYYTNLKSKDFRDRMRARQDKYNSMIVVMPEAEKKAINCARNLLHKQNNMYLGQVLQKRPAESITDQEDLIDLRSEVSLGRLIFVAKGINSPALEVEAIIYDANGKVIFEGTLVNICKNILDRYIYY